MCNNESKVYNKIKICILRLACISLTTNTFLHEDLAEQVFLDQPLWYVSRGSCLGFVYFMNGLHSS